MNIETFTRKEFSELIKNAYNACIEANELPFGAGEIVVSMPKDSANGDYSTTFALAAAKALSKPPREIAERIISRVCLEGSSFSSINIAGAGYINVFVSDDWKKRVIDAVNNEKERYGFAREKTGRRVMVEFVSANPTGPMTIGNARGGVLGDTLANVLAAAGNDVYKEFYLNDAGNQIDNFAKSIECRYLQAFGVEAELPPDGYHGDYIGDFARDYIALYGDSLLSTSPEERQNKLSSYAIEIAVNNMKRDLERYNVHFDNWFSESSLYNNGYVEETIQMLINAGHTYENDGALFLAAEKFGGDKDEVLRRSNGFYTYYAADLAYHRDKLVKRGFDLTVNVLGADHHGHTLRFVPGIKALGIDESRLKFVLMQFVNLLRDGETVRMSKRTGKAITLSDLLDEIPVHAARFFFNWRCADTKLDFDLDLAVKNSSENPVYYVQYAHARICTLFSAVGGAENGFDPSLLNDETERELIRTIALYPEEIILAAKEYDPSRINRYLIELASKFHKFYDSCRIKDADTALRSSRLHLAAAARTVLHNALTLLGIPAPEKM